VTIDQHDAVKLIQIDDGKANAYSGDVLATISAAIDAAESNDSTSAVVIAGRPGVFSGGFDLGVMRNGTPAERSNLVSSGGTLVRQCFGANIPVVAACTGHAVAAGALVLLGCDLRIGPDTDSKIGLPEVTIGMPLPLWAVTIGQSRLNESHLHRCTALGDMLTPTEAIAAGFLDEVVPAEGVIDRAMEAAGALAAKITGSAYASIVRATRGDTLATMDLQIAADRAAVS